MAYNKILIGLGRVIRQKYGRTNVLLLELASQVTLGCDWEDQDRDQDGCRQLVIYLDESGLSSSAIAN